MQRLIDRLNRAVPTLFGKIVIANGLLIGVGAVMGMLLSHTLTDPLRQGMMVAVLVAAVGFAIFLNYVIVRLAFEPLNQFVELTEQVRAGQTKARVEVDPARDTEVHRLAGALNTMLDELENQRHQLASSILRAQEEERIRVARELHDEAAQALTTLIIHLDVLADQLPADHPGLRDRVKRAKDLTTRTLGDVRRLIYDLRPSVLDDLGLVAALNWIIREKLEPAGIKVAFTAPPEAGPGSLGNLTPDQHTALFRVFQEAATNVIRHSQATHMTIRLEADEAAIRLLVRDNGRGFVTAQVRSVSAGGRGLGLIGMKERISLLGGRWDLRSLPGRGTTIEVTLPRHGDGPGAGAGPGAGGRPGDRPGAGDRRGARGPSRGGGREAGRGEDPRSVS